MHLSYPLAKPSSAMLISTDVEESRCDPCCLASGPDRRLDNVCRPFRLRSAYRRGANFAFTPGQPEPLSIDAPDEPDAAARLPQQSVERATRTVAIESVGP